MTQKAFTKNPMAAAFGAALLVSAMHPAMAGENPFAAKTMASGYELAMGNADKAAKAEVKCGADKAGTEAQCGADKAKAAHEGKCGEAKCEADGAKAGHEGKCGDGKCGAEKAKAAHEGKCGEAKCGADKSKAATEGKCGEGKCGAGHMAN